MPRLTKDGKYEFTPMDFAIKWTILIPGSIFFVMALIGKCMGPTP